MLLEERFLKQKVLSGMEHISENYVVSFRLTVNSDTSEEAFPDITVLFAQPYRSTLTAI